MENTMFTDKIIGINIEHKLWQNKYSKPNQTNSKEINNNKII